MKRRSFLKAAGLAGLGVAAGTSEVLGAGSADAATANAASVKAASANPIDVAKYKLLVPEIFAPVPDAPAYTQAIVIGSGFGGAVSAYRLAKAGVQVTVLERGSQWPSSPWRATFANDTLPDGRALWHRTSFTNASGLTYYTDDFGGVLDVTDFNGISVWRGAAVGGGSIVYTGAHPVPEKPWFDAVFGGKPTYAEMTSQWYPLARSVLQVSPMPNDIYNSSTFSHSRTWDSQVSKAGYTPQIIDGIWNWATVRSEIAGKTRASASVGESNFGNADGAKFDLTQNYLKYAQATGNATIYPQHSVTAIGQDGQGRYLVSITKTDAAGNVLSSRTIGCSQLYLAAGSIGTTELLMRARSTGALSNLNEAVGCGWGTNGDAAVGWAHLPTGVPQGAPSRSRIVDTSGAVPVTLENWYVPGVPIDVGIIGSLAMTLDPTRADFTFDTTADQLQLNWPGLPNSYSATKKLSNKISSANWSLSLVHNDSFTAHPLGGAVLGKATDWYGRVTGYQGLYVMDGAMVPGSTGLTNPSLTITALAERNIAAIITAGG